MIFDEMNLMSALLEIFAAVITGVLLAGCFFEENKKSLTVKLLIGALASHTAMMLCDAPIWLLLEHPTPTKIIAVKVLSFLSDLFACTIIALYSYCMSAYISERKQMSFRYANAISVLCGVFVLLCLISSFNGMIIDYDENGNEVFGSFYVASQIIYVLLLVGTIVLSIANRKTLGYKDTLIWVLFGAIPIIAMPIQYFWSVTPVYLSSTISLILVYDLVHIQHAKHSAQMEKKLVEQELALSESRNALVLSQIQPHFLYNALTSIYRLCDIKPEAAKDAISDFSNYLRGNLDSIRQTKPIPFSEELKHIQAYLSLEKIRYDERLEIVYDIQTKEFFIPPLTVQPLVENAINHGISDLPDGGCVKLITAESDDCYEVRVEDNGVGFNQAPTPNDNRSHIGISNVRMRLEIMCNGNLDIISSPNNGTIAIIKIPKGES